MSGYIGNILVPQATQTRDSFIATAGQTSFPTSGYTPNFLDVYLNGIKLHSSDFTATNGSDVVLATGASVNDVIEVVAYNAFDVASGTFDDLTVNNNIAVGGTVDGRDIATDGTKLDGIESGATGDQTNAEIRAAVEAATDSNVFTDADHTKLNAIEASATADQTASEIRTLVESATDSNVFTDADHTKLNAIESGATADQTKSDIEGLGIDVPATNLTGTIPAARLSTATTQAESDDSTKIATTAYVVDKITTLIGGAPSTLNDLNELAAAINDDANYNSTLTTALATKLPLAGGTLTGNLDVGGTVTADGLTVDGGVNSELRIDTDAAGYLQVGQFTNGAFIGTSSTNATYGKLRLGAGTKRFVDVDTSGDISFYEDTGTTAKFFWDASAESLGIGTSSPTNLLHLKEEGYQLKIEDTSSGNTGEVLVSDTSLYLFSDRSNAKANSDIRFSVDNSERVRITSSGNIHLNSGLDARVQLGNSGTGSTSVSDNSVYVRGNDDDLILGAAGNGNIYLKENADIRMAVRAGGDVGIGTSSPAKKFHVHSGNQSDIVKFENDNGGFALGKTANLGSLDMASDANFRIRHGGTVSATFKSDGNVGIGDTNPSYKLSVNNGTSDGGIFRLYNEEVGLNVAVDGTTGSPNYTNSSRTVTFNATRMDSGSSPKLRLGGQGGLEFAADANNVRMVINTGGNVGIGRASPQSKLDVLSSARITSAANAGHSLKLEARSDFANDADSALIWISDGGSSSNPLFQSAGAHLVIEGRKSTSRHIYFKVGDTTTAQHIMLANGRVGIGTTSPSEKLHVSGNVSATAYYGDGSNLTGVGGSTAYGAVGTYVWAKNNSNSMTSNSTHSGSNITALGGITSNNNSIWNWTITSGALSGTWRALGGGNDTRGSHHRVVALFVRIS